MSAKRTAWSAATSYLAMGSGVVTGLLLIRVATQHLEPEEFGLWSFCFGSIGYLLLFDFGVVAALGRIFADSVARRDHREMSEWLLLTLGVLGVQAMLVLGVGLFARDWLLSFFEIPDELLGEASRLWTWLLGIQAAVMPLRALAGILHAQNRVYRNHFFSILATWLNLIFFWWWIARGAGVMAYAYAALVANSLVQVGYLVSVFTGSERLRLQWMRPSLSRLRELFSYSSAIFVQQLTVQFIGSSRTMVLAKLLGLDAVAVYTVTARMPTMLSELAFKPILACFPRWTLQFCEGRLDQMREEYVRVFRIILLIVGAGSCLCILANGAFVQWWTKPEFYGGHLLTNLIAASVLFTALQNALAYAFRVTKQVGRYSVVLLIGFGFEVGLGIVFVKWIGVPGIPAASLVIALLFVFWFHLVVGSRLLGVPVGRSSRVDAAMVLACIGLSVAIVAAGDSRFPLEGFPRLLTAVGLAAAISLPIFLRMAGEIRQLDLGRLLRNRPNRQAAGDEKATPMQ